MDLSKILEQHKKWLNNESGGKIADLRDVCLCNADLRGADLSHANLRGSDLSDADLRGANLHGAVLRDADLTIAKLSDADLSDADLNNTNLHRANLRDANLSDANLRFAVLASAYLRGANLRDADLGHADLSGADLSDAKNLLSAIDFLDANFEKTSDGFIAYKCFGGRYNPPEEWLIHAGSIISENVNSNRTDDCGCGINVAPIGWVRKNYPNKEIWRVLIRWEWLCGVCVPYNTDGKIRCERVELLEVVE